MSEPAFTTRTRSDWLCAPVAGRTVMRARGTPLRSLIPRRASCSSPCAPYGSPLIEKKERVEAGQGIESAERTRLLLLAILSFV
jgi:hypothetical protein